MDLSNKKRPKLSMSNAMNDFYTEDVSMDANTVFNPALFGYDTFKVYLFHSALFIESEWNQWFFWV